MRDIKMLEDETNALGLFFKCKGTEKYKRALEHLIKEYKKKDMIIEKIAEQLTSPIHNKEWVIEYFTNKIQEEN